MGISGALICGTSAQDAWAIVNFLQVILLLPLAVKSMDKTAQDFVVSNAFSAFSVYYLPVEALKSMPVIKNISFDQPDEYLRVLGWPSGSTVVNNMVLLMILYGLAIFHILTCLFYRPTKNEETKFSAIVKKAYRLFNYTLYIRSLIVIYMFTILMVFSEIKYYYKNQGEDNFGHQKEGNKNEAKGNSISLLISCIILFMLLSFVVLTFISWKRNKDTINIDETCKTLELYADL